jgi:hypothetical protein
VAYAAPGYGPRIEPGNPMRVPCLHPVPVRFRPARLRHDRHAFLAASTPVDVPEATRAPERVDILTASGYETCHLHAGLLYERMTWGSAIGSGNRVEPIRPENLAKLLAGPRDMPGPAFRRGTPLRASGLLKDKEQGSGSDLPPSITARSAGDNAQAARAALVRHVAREFLVDGDHAYVRRRLPVLAPHHDPKRPRGPDSLERNGYGIHFEPARFPNLTTYLSRIGYRMSIAEQAHMIGTFVKENAAPDAYAGDDLDLWVNDAPHLVEILHLRALAHPYAGDLSHLDPNLALLRPYADLGLVGAVPPEARALVAELVGNVLDGLRSAIPAENPQPPLNWMKAYSDLVARPTLCDAPIPDADAEDLSALAPFAGR